METNNEAPVSAVQVEPLYRSGIVALVFGSWYPPIATTSPFSSSTKVGYQRAYAMEPVRDHEVPLKTLACLSPFASPKASLCPPATSSRPSLRKVCPLQNSSQVDGSVQVVFVT